MAAEFVRGTSVASENEDYVDAAEEIVPTDDEGEEDAKPFVDHGPMGREYRGEDRDSLGSEAGDGEMEDDLFESTFGNKTTGDTDDEDEIAPSKNDFVDIEHSKGCNSARGPPTPPPNNNTNFTSNITQTNMELCDHPPPDPIKDRSWALRRLERFHLRAKELIPRLPLKEERYWIGVLSDEKNSETFKNEKDFVWMSTFVNVNLRHLY